jgi:hypothetical protein
MARLPDGWNWDPLSGTNGAWLYFRDGQYLAWVEPKHGLFLANWRLGRTHPESPGSRGIWADPRGEDPEHVRRNPYEAMQHAESKAQ